GCGNGRWSFGLASLGAHLTCVDINPVAVEKTRAALEGCDVPKTFLVSPLEDVAAVLRGRRFDLVFSWGVLHHARSFTRALEALASLVKPDGVLYLYLYGRQTLSFAADIALFKERVRY